MNFNTPRSAFFRALDSVLVFLAVAICQLHASAGENATATANALRHVLKPRIVGDWWKISGDPDLGRLTTTNQEPVDFGIWQAADHTWQLWSCIRGTTEKGKTRLFYRW